MKKHQKGRFDYWKVSCFKTAKIVAISVFLGLESLFWLLFSMVVITFDGLPSMFVFAMGLFTLMMISVYSLVSAVKNKPFVIANQIMVKLIAILFTLSGMMFASYFERYGNDSGFIDAGIAFGITGGILLLIWAVSYFYGISLRIQNIRTENKRQYEVFYVDIEELNLHWNAAAKEYCQLYGKDFKKLTKAEKKQIDDCAALPMSYMVTWLLFHTPSEYITDSEGFAQLKNRTLLPTQFVLNNVDCCLITEVWAVPYRLYDFLQGYCYDENGYIADYRSVVQNTYCDSFSWDTYAKLEEILNTKLSAFAKELEYVYELDPYELWVPLDDMEEATHTVYWKLFHCYIDILGDDDDSEDYAKDSVEDLLNKPDEVMLVLIRSVFQISNELSDKELLRKLSNLIRPMGITIHSQPFHYTVWGTTTLTADRKFSFTILDGYLYSSISILPPIQKVD